MPARARLHSNWIYFAVIYTVMAFAMGALSIGLEFVQVRVPGGEIALSTCGFIVAAMLAGLRYVRTHGNVWTGRERHHLALVYTLTTLVVSAVVTALWVLAATVRGETIEDISPMLLDPVFQVILVILFVVWLILTYALARLALFVVDRAAHAGAGQTS